MNQSIQYEMNKASIAEMAEHLIYCDADFVPPLSSRVDINDYAKKMVNHGVRFEAWSGNKLVGLVGAYCNDLDSRTAFITSVSVLADWKRRGLAVNLIIQSIAFARDFGMQKISLEVAKDNKAAIHLYQRTGFVVGAITAQCLAMELCLE